MQAVAPHKHKPTHLVPEGSMTAVLLIGSSSAGGKNAACHGSLPWEGSNCQRVADHGFRQGCPGLGECSHALQSGSKPGFQMTSNNSPGNLRHMPRGWLLGAALSLEQARAALIQKDSEVCFLFATAAPLSAGVGCTSLQPY